MVGASDDAVLLYAQQHNRVLLTRNCSDFYDLHQITSNHPGILAIYQDADLDKNMSYPAIVTAIANVEASGLKLISQIIVLNQWSYCARSRALLQMRLQRLTDQGGVIR